MNGHSVKVSKITKPYLFQHGAFIMHLPPQDLKLLEESAPARLRKRGDHLFHAGGFPRSVYWLHSGKVKIFQQTPNGHRQTTYIYSDGDLFGFRQFIAEEPHPVSARLLEDSHVSIIPGDIFRQLMANSPSFTREILTILAKEFSVWANRMTLYTKYDVSHRIQLALLILSEQYRLSGSPPGIITITRTELSEFVGATLETVVRTLNKLKNDRLVKVEGRRISILDMNRLVEQVV